MKKILLASWSFWLAFSICQAQEVLSSQGGSYQTDEVVLDFTLGESIIETYSNTEISILQGFHQTYVIDDAVTALSNSSRLKEAVSIYPNPTMDFLKLEIKNFQGLNYKIYDLNGRTVLQSELTDQVTKIDILKLPEATYQLILTDPKRQEFNGYLIIKK